MVELTESQTRIDLKAQGKLTYFPEDDTIGILKEIEEKQRAYDLALKIKAFNTDNQLRETFYDGIAA